MAKLQFPRKELEKHITLDAKTIEKLALFGTPLESLTEESAELEISANRPDLLSMRLFINAFKQFLGKKTTTSYATKKGAKEYTVRVDSSVKAVRPYTACAVVKGLTLNEANIKELVLLQEKLHGTAGRNRKKAALGLYPLDKIEFPLKYEARKPAEIVFTPLGSSKKMNGKEILEKHPTGKEHASLLQSASRYPVFVDAKGALLSMPPIINSEETGRITTATKNIFVECSGMAQETVDYLLLIMTLTLAEMGGTIYTMTVQDKPTRTTPEIQHTSLKISKDNINARIGLSLKDSEIASLLAKMGLATKGSSVSIPAWRSDILHEVDVTEEVAVGYGYDRLLPELPALATIAQESKETTLAHKIRSILTGLGFLEISSLHFITQEEQGLWSEDALELESSKTEYKLLRPNLALPLLRTLSRNTDVEYPQKVFELGTVFKKDAKSETGVREEIRLALGITPGNFTDAKQVLDYLFSMLGEKYELTEKTLQHYIDGRSAAVHHNHKAIGIIGEMHPATLSDFKLKMPLAVIELDTSAFHAEH